MSGAGTNRCLRHNQLELAVIYHSHPASEAYPSATDITLAFYPEALYLIISLADPEKPLARAFRITDGQVQEVGFTLV